MSLATNSPPPGPQQQHHLYTDPSLRLIRCNSFPDYTEFVDDDKEAFMKYRLQKHISMDSPTAFTNLPRNVTSPQLVESLQSTLRMWGTSTDSIHDLLKIVMRHVNTVRASQGLPMLVASLRPQPRLQPPRETTTRQTTHLSNPLPINYATESPLRETKLAPTPQQVEELLDLALSEMSPEDS
ncbi:hypothetical protein Pelo_2253 [Pelomyxa schiedti]|nr:hypothetical protein Pelo_2253 [Pelomyxa schiedti]